MFKGLMIGALAATLAACGASQPRPGAAAVALPAVIPPAGGDVRRYHVDTAQSELRVLVFRAGPMARLGHNHVMVNRALQGSVDLAGPQPASTFSLSIPVAEFIVDDSRARSEEGADFPGEISQDAKAGTLHNMLGAALLDASAHPVMTVDSKMIQGGQGEFTATVRIRVAGRESIVELPFTLVIDGEHLTASGSAELRQSVLGLTPFSLMMGALQVQDLMRLKFRIVAAAG